MILKWKITKHHPALDTLGRSTSSTSTELFHSKSSGSERFFLRLHSSSTFDACPVEFSRLLTHRTAILYEEFSSNTHRHAIAIISASVSIIITDPLYIYALQDEVFVILYWLLYRPSFFFFFDLFYPNVRNMGDDVVYFYKNIEKYTKKYSFFCWETRQKSLIYKEFVSSLSFFYKYHRETKNN